MSNKNISFLEGFVLPFVALIGSLFVFGLFVFVSGQSPVEAWKLLFLGAFGDAFSIQNTLQRAAPLMLTALCVAIPANAGLTVIGGEGSLLVGALACSAVPYFWSVPLNTQGTCILMMASCIGGACWMSLVGVMRQYRGVNETISSLLLAYLAVNVFKHLVEGPMRDPGSLNKPSTFALNPELLIGGIAGYDVHWGLVWGLVFCVLASLWLKFTSHGFATKVVGGNPRAASFVGLPTNGLIITACALGGAAAGLAGGFEIAAIHTASNASVIAGLGYTGILVSFAARHKPMLILPVAIVLGGFGSAGSLLQRRLGLPDASIQVLMGFAFIFILAAESARGRIQWSRIWRSKIDPNALGVR